MLDAIYDPGNIRVISEALAGALLALDARIRRRIGPAEKAGLAARITQVLLDAYHSGERNPETLNRVALSAIKDLNAPWAR